MANLRILSDNAVDRALSVAASNTVAALPASNMQTDYKTEVWRTLSGSQSTITLTWPSSELVNCVIFAFSNLSPTATAFVRCYAENDATITSTILSQTLAPSTNFGDVGWGTAPIGSNAANYGGGAYGTIWFPSPRTVKKLSILITDLDNTSGYMEAGRLIVGNYWSPTYNAEAGATLGIVDTSKNERADSGELRTDRGTIHKTLSFEMNYLTNADRNQMYGIMRNGIYKPMFVCLTPESVDDTMGEQIHQLYGKMTRTSALKYQLLGQFSTSLELEEI